MYSEKYAILSRSPLMLQALRLLVTKNATLTDVCLPLKRTKPSTSRALHGLVKLGLIKYEVNRLDRRKPIFSVRDAKLVHRLLTEVSLQQGPPRNFRAMRFAVTDLERMVKDGLASRLEGWNMTRDRMSQTLVLQHAGNPSEVVVKLVPGGKQFEQTFFTTIGELAVVDPPKRVVLVVFGRVSEETAQFTENGLRAVMSAQKSTLDALWLDRGPMAAEQQYINDQVVDKIVPICTAPQTVQLASNS